MNLWPYNATFNALSNVRVVNKGFAVDLNKKSKIIADKTLILFVSGNPALPIIRLPKIFSVRFFHRLANRYW